MTRNDRDNRSRDQLFVRLKDWSTVRIRLPTWWSHASTYGSNRHRLRARGGAGPATLPNSRTFQTPGARLSADKWRRPSVPPSPHVLKRFPAVEPVQETRRRHKRHAAVFEAAHVLSRRRKRGCEAAERLRSCPLIPPRATETVSTAEPRLMAARERRAVPAGSARWPLCGFIPPTWPY